MSSRRRNLLLALLLAALPATAHAQITIPNSFVNGTPADATLVNANFATLGSNALNRTGGTMTGTLTSQAITPATDATYALGDATHRYTNEWLSGTLSVVGTTTLGATVHAGAVTLTPSNTNDLGGVGAVPRDLYYGRNAVGPAQLDDGNTGAAITVNFATGGPIQKVTRTANTTITLTAPPSAGYVTLVMLHDGTANVYTVAFSPAVKWPGGVAGTFTNTANAVDILNLYWSGASWFVALQTNFS